MKTYRILFCLFLIGCATPYQSTGFSGGFSEIQLSENIFKVSFHGNGYTSSERVSDFALLRCAEVAQSNGFIYFSIIEDENYSTKSSYTTPTKTQSEARVSGNTVTGSSTTSGGQTYIISKPSSANIIVCFKDKPDGVVYNVNFIIPSIKNKYGIKK